MDGTKQAFRLDKIISGGQTGADQGGLYAARELGIPTGGVAPRGWQTEEGPQPDLLRGFGLRECSEPGYPARTRDNVFASDGTLLVGQYQSGGSALTHKIAMQAANPIFHLEFPPADQVPEYIRQSDPRFEEFRHWLLRHRVRTMNVAGNRESQSRGIQEFTREFIIAALSTWSR
ncbi:MAG TPA: putative molybdenum carrier protein [Terriglobia bacterium]|nr:putative molybdenum carrier protein [Terriglobia bacterium]